MTTALLQPNALSTLVELLRWCAAHQPDQRIYTFLADGESAAHQLTAAQLDLQARTIAAQLQASDLSGKRALLLFPPGLEYIAAFFGCLYAGVIAVPAYPPPANRPPLRLQAMLANARAAVALTTTTTFTKLEPQLAHAPELRDLHWICIDTLTQDAGTWHAPTIDDTTIAFLQYTSGSTASPKGVVLSHGNLLHNLGQIYRCFGHSAQSQGVIWLPPYHDMGLIGGILQPLYGGFPVTLMAPVAFLQSPIRWLQAISRYGATTSGGPNFAYELCARKITPEQRATLDLSSWEVAFTGAEPIRSETLDLFANTFAECGFRREAFYPCYGLAEVTLIVTGGALHAPPVVQTIASAELEQNRVRPTSEGPATQTLVGSGQNLPDQRIAIVNPHTCRACEPDEVGEIWVAGPSVAQGYWEQPDLTAETFQARLADDQSGPFLRTGDLGFLHAGELFVTGRLKDLIIIRGRNHYPQDIELTVEHSHPALRPASGAAFSIDVHGEERLVVVQEVERQHRKTDPTAIVAAIRAAVATQHDVQVYAVVLLKPGGIPKTSSGKIQRHACRIGFLADTLDVLSSDVLTDADSPPEAITLTRSALLMLPPPERPAAISAYLQQRIKQIVRSSAQYLDPQQSLSAMGIDSLQAVELATQLEVDLAVVLPMARLLEGPSITQLTAELLSQLEAPAAELQPIDVIPDPAALSYGQRALWFLHRLAPTSSAYNIAGAVRTSAPVETDALAQALQQLIARHPALRTTFALRATALQPEPVQQIHAEMSIPVQEVDATAWDTATLKRYLHEAAQQPFDLEHGPLLRLTLVTCAAQQQMLLLVMHHIVTDFWSLAVLVDELGQLYAAACDQREIALPPLSHDYSAYVQWQHELLHSSSGTQQWNYWQRQLRPEGTRPLPVLDLPSDRPRPPIQTDRGATETLLLSSELHQQLLRLSEAHGVTLYMTLLAAFQVLLARYSGQTDILVGSTTAGRNRAWLAPLIGYFVNPVVLRTNLAHNPTFATLLQQVRQTVLDAFAHQDYPFPLLVERLQPQRDPARSPIFQVLFTFHQGPRLDAHSLSGLALGREGTQLQFGPIPVEVVELEQQSAQFDLTLLMGELTDGLGATLQYNRDLFDATTIQRMLGHFATLLAAVASDPAQYVQELPLLTAAERHQLLHAWNATQTAYPEQSGLHDLVTAQARRTPDRIAVTFDQQQLSYDELNRRANQLARALRRRGVGAPGHGEVRVGLCVERSLDMIVGLLGILKAGGAYIPLDPAYPAERIAYVLADARAPIMVTQHALTDALPQTNLEILCLDSDWSSIALESQDDLESVVSPDQLAYVIYTSGSTGRPKGVQIPHRAVVNFLASMQRQPGLTEQDVLLSVTTLAFDIAALEIFLPLTVGARLVLASRLDAVNGRRLGALLHDAQVTVMQATPATWRLLLNAGWTGSPGLRMLCGGEAFPPDLAEQLVERGAAVWNMYGPTETTIWSVIHQLTPGHGSVPIGQPISNTQVYVLDQQLQPVPVGVPGALYIAGAGLARGYCNRPELTAERFVPDPFSSLNGNLPGGRMYHTGDLARWRADGTLECLGRSDFQIKLRGFRIELGEIEAVLAQYPGVQQVVVVAQAMPHQPDDKRLVAYVVGEQKNKEQKNKEQGDEPDGSRFLVLGSSDLRAFAKAQLPEYMVPTAFVVLDTLPLTPNGKIDRNALPTPTELRVAPEVMALPAPVGIERTIAEVWQSVLGLQQVSIHDNFFDLGGHSLLVAQVHARLRDEFGFAVELIDLFKYPTIDTLASYLRSSGQAKHVSAPVATHQPRAATTDVAIIGLNGRFPGAADVAAFWTNLCGGVEAISFFSDDELLAAGVEPATLRDPQYVKARGVLDQIDQFDASFFGINPREAQIMDPQHRIFLEASWSALEDAGYDPGRYPGRISVYAGVGINTYMLQASQALIAAGGRYQAFIGNDKDFVPTRVSYKLGLRGPSVNVQTACSSSLVAVHLACQSLLHGEADMALAGGISISVPHTAGYFYEQGGIPSPDGRCRPFDAQAQGTVFGSGVGIVVLKRLDAALRDGDTIHAVIRGSAINNDGAAKIGYTAPSIDGQAQVIADALVAAQVDPQTIGYIEAHGTGTPLGDPIEVAALAQAFRHYDRSQGRCALGSVKASVGHLDTAAGVAGLIKTVLALKHQQIPPSLNFATPNPQIDFTNSPFFVNTGLADWTRNGTPRRAGVSSFGIGGTNAHLILEEAPPKLAREPGQPWQVLVLSARSAPALEQATANLAAYLREHAHADLADVAYTLQVGRKAFAHRRVVVCRDQAVAISALEGHTPEQLQTAIAGEHQPAVAFLFPGQGAQYVGMGQELYQQEAVFRAAVDTCCDLLLPQLGLDLRELLYPESGRLDAAREQLNQTQTTQPALFVIEYALAQLWQSWGIMPQALIGHSIGEYVAATLAGVMTLEDALKLVALRGRLIQDLPAGAMLAIPRGEAEVRAFLHGAPSGSGTRDIDLAAINGPSACVVSGTPAAIADLEHSLSGRGITARRLHTSHAFHSAMMEPILAAFTEQLRRVQLSAPTIPFISNVSGTWITADEATDPVYWARHLREPVRFADGVRELLRDDARVLLEVGPGQTLSSLARQQSTTHTIVQTLRHPQDSRPDLQVLNDAVGRLWLANSAINWDQLHRSERCRIPLPTYPFERQRYWIDPPKSSHVPQRSPGKQPDLDEWFYTPFWKQSVLPATPPISPTSWLIFADATGLGAQLAQELIAAGHQVTVVHFGAQFGQTAAGTYTLDPARRADYDTLLAALHTAGQTPTQIVHAWAVDQIGLTADAVATTERTLDVVFHSLLFLAQALDQQQVSGPLRLIMLSNNMQRVAGEPLLQPAKSTLLGPCRVIPQEYPHITCQSIDVVLPPPHSAAAEDLLDHLLIECLRPGTDTIVAYRGASRWVQTVESIRMDSSQALAPQLRDGGVYLITGGLGGIGLVLARQLAQTVRAKLVLIGRRALPPREEWPEWLAMHDPQDQTSQRIAGVQALEALGAEVLVLSADVADREQMTAALAQAQAAFGAVQGVIHAAGVAGGGLLQLKTPASTAHVLRPKVQGTLILHVLLQQIQAQPLDFFVLCSSINAVIGGFGQVDYCAANAFLDSFAASHATRRGPRYLSINWDRWQETGMAVETAVPATFAALQRHVAHTPIDHPLLHARVTDSADHVVYHSTFTVAQQWVLSEHKIVGKATVPGTTYLEMVRAAFAQHAAHDTIEIRDVLFVAPLVVLDHEVKEVQTILEPGAGHSTFRVISRVVQPDGTAGAWQQHVQGQIGVTTQPEPEPLNLAAIAARCGPPEALDALQAAAAEQRAFLEAGPRWQSLTKVHLGSGEGLGRLELNPAFSAELAVLPLHPALLDVATGSIQRIRRGSYLPLTYGALRIYHPLTRVLYSHVRYLHDERDTNETLTCNIMLTDESGRCLVEINAFSMRRVSGAAVEALKADLAAPATPINANRPGILSDEGWQVFKRLLAGTRLPQIVVSVQPLELVIEQAQRLNADRIIEETSSLSLQPTQARPQLTSPFVAPETELEQQLAQIWQQVLGIERIGVYDNFFELGGTSLSGIQLVAELKKHLHTDIPTVSIFEAPTVRSLAKYLNPERDDQSTLQRSLDRADRKLARKRKR